MAINRLLRFSTTLTRRQAIPPAMRMKKPVTFIFETIQDTPSNGLTLRPWANNRVFPEDPDAQPVDPAPNLVGQLSAWTVTQNTASQTYNAAVGFSGVNLTYELEDPIPEGVTINQSTGVVSANTVATGLGTKAIKVRARNGGGIARQPLDLIITNPIVPPTLVGVLTDWLVNIGTGSKTYNAASGFTGATLTYTLQTGSTGVSINGTTGVVTVDTTVPTVGTKALVIRATNGAGFVDQPLNLIVAAAVAAPTLGSALSEWKVPTNVGQSTYLTVVGFTGTGLTYSLVNPPTGIVINSASGRLTIADSTVLSLGSRTIVIRATNISGFVDANLVVTVYAAPVKVGTLAAWVEVQGTGTKTYASAPGFSGSFITYSLATPVTGISINASTGVVSADTALVALGANAITVRATNGAGFVDQPLTLNLNAALAAPTKVGTLAAWNIQQSSGNQTYNAAVGFNGSTIVYSLQVGATGVSINSSTGIITADTSVVTVGTKSLTVRATNGAGFVEQALSLTMTALAVPAKVGALANWLNTVGTGPKTYNAAAGFSGQGITYTIQAPGASGFSINGTTGLITATLAAVVASTVLTVRATNASGYAEQQFTVEVQAVQSLPKAPQLQDTDFNMLGTVNDPAYPAPSTQETGVIEIPIDSVAFDSTEIFWGNITDVPMPAVYIGKTSGGAKLYRCTSTTGQHMKNIGEYYGGIYVYHRTPTTQLSDPSNATSRFTVILATDRTACNFKPEP